MRPFTVPSIQNPSQNNNELSTFLSNNENRKLYNQTIGKIKKFQNICASNQFLSQCIHEELIPRTFNIRNKPQNKPKGSETTWNDISKEASINHMKEALKVEEIKASDLLAHITEAFNTLNFLSDKAREPLKQRFAFKGYRFKMIAEAEKNKKLKEI